MAARGLRFVAIVFVVSSATVSSAVTEGEIRELIAEGSYAEAEQLLKNRITDASAPVTTDAAIQLEILRRTRRDFPLTEQEVLDQLQESIPDAASADVAGEG